MKQVVPVNQIELMRGSIGFNGGSFGFSELAIAGLEVLVFESSMIMDLLEISNEKY